MRITSLNPRQFMNTHVKLNDGNEMPIFGLGVWQSKGEDALVAVSEALSAGYRHIDTAAIYGNEDLVGQALRASDVPREDVWITTKLWNDKIRGRQARKGLEESLEKLQMDYVDLYLLHWAVDGIEDAWLELEQAQKDGLVKSIGISNHMPEHIERLIEVGSVVPAVNQVELHPQLHQQEVLDACAKHGIAVEGWSPLMQGNFKSVPLFGEIGESYDKTAAQVIIRWAIQRGFITIPKSVTPHRIRENGDVFDFELSTDHMAAIDALNKEERFGPDPRNISF